jgi:hypothetical protein
LETARPRPSPPRRREGRRLALPEPLEEPRQRLGADPLAGVTDAHLGARVLLPQGDADLAALRGELDRVRDQVAEHLLEPRGVAENERRERSTSTSASRRSALSPAAGRAAWIAASISARRSTLRSSSDSFAGLDLVDVEQIRDELGLELAVAGDDLDPLLAIVLGHPASLEDLGPPEMALSGVRSSCDRTAMKSDL